MVIRRFHSARVRHRPLEKPAWLWTLITFPARAGELFVTILRHFKVTSARWGTLVRAIGVTLLLASFTACGASSPPPTADVVLHPSLVFSVDGTTAPLDRTWNQQAWPGRTVTITFMTNPNGLRCVAYHLDSSGEAPVQRSIDISTTLVAVQGVETDTDGKVYTLIVGRALSDQITAVSLELPGGASQPTDVINGAFVLALPGQHLALRGVPVDQYGNLVGTLFTFQ